MDGVITTTNTTTIIITVAILLLQAHNRLLSITWLYAPPPLHRLNAGYTAVLPSTTTIHGSSTDKTPLLMEASPHHHHHRQHQQRHHTVLTQPQHQHHLYYNPLPSQPEVKDGGSHDYYHSLLDLSAPWNRSNPPQAISVVGWRSDDG